MCSAVWWRTWAFAPVYPRQRDLSGTLPEDAAKHEQHVRRPLREPSHEVRIPLGSVRDVHPQARAAIEQAALEVAPDAVQHLVLEPIGTDAALARGGGDALEHVGIVRRDAGVRIGLEEALAEGDERIADGVALL